MMTESDRKQQWWIIKTGKFLDKRFKVFEGDKKVKNEWFKKNESIVFELSVTAT